MDSGAAQPEKERSTCHLAMTNPCHTRTSLLLSSAHELRRRENAQQSLFPFQMGARHLISYRYAQRNDGVVVDVTELNPTEDGNAEYFCVGCHSELIAKIHGTKVTPHFAHKPNSTCCSETYLHRLGIKVFKETFERCKEEGLPFHIELPHPRACDKFQRVFGAPCIFQHNDYVLHDIASCCLASLANSIIFGRSTTLKEIVHD
jgi:hypothetical protein